METIQKHDCWFTTHTSRVLLAYYVERHPVLREGVRQMPKLQQHHTTTVRIAYPDELSLAIPSVGARHNGTVPMAMQQLKFLIFEIDYFTKWVEVEPFATITEKNVRSFIWKNIICHFGIPRVFASDNRKQFDNDAFRDFCQ